MSRKVIGNAASLMSVQIAGYVLPLVNVPYLLRILGPEHYGLIAFSQACMTYFLVLNDYGFNLSATRELAICREDRKRRSELYSAVMTIKVGLCIISFLILAALVYLIPRFHANWRVFFASFVLVVGNMLFPSWFFQGLEKMYWISVVNLTASIAFTFGIFLVVHRSSDFVLAALIQSCGRLLAGVLGVVIVFSTTDTTLSLPTYANLRTRLLDGWHLFLSQIAVTFYTSSNTVVLGFIRGMAEVGYFSAANKILAAGQGLVSPMCQAMYPHVSALSARSREAAVGYLRKAMLVIGGITLAGGLIVFALAAPIVRIAMGGNYLAAVPVLRFMSFIPFACAINNIYGTQGMLNFGMRREFTRIIISSALMNIVILLPLVYAFGAPGAAAAALLTEVVVTIYMGLVMYRSGIQILPIGQRPHSATPAAPAGL